MRRLLELFSGTKSVSKAVGTLFDEIISVDVLQEFEPSVVSDILDWDYTKYPPGYFYAIWASPPCTEYSCLNVSNPGKIPNIDLANRIVKRTIEIIEYYNPHIWFIENPQTGTLKNQEFMDFIPFYDVDYCQYSTFGYRKRTRIWTCVDNFKPQLCPGKNQCSQMIPGTNWHKTSNGYYKKDLKRPDSSKEERYRIPQKLIHELFNCN